MSPNESISSSIKKVDNFIGSLNLPRINIDLKEREDLDFSKLTHYDNKEIEDFLAIYGGYKAYLEIKRIHDNRSNASESSPGFSPILLQAASDSTSVYFAAIGSATITYGADDLEFIFHIERQ